MGNISARIVLFLLLSFTIGCSYAHIAYNEKNTDVKSPSSLSDDDYRDQLNNLQKDLTALNKNVDPQDAQRVADTALSVSLALASEYRLVHPPLFHNVLVNFRLKDRGLCIQWTVDLLKQLSQIDQASFQLHWAIAYSNSLIWRDHSSVVVTAKGQAFDEGIVFDPWRNSGKLHWVPVKRDRYPWKPIPSAWLSLFLGKNAIRGMLTESAVDSHDRCFTKSEATH